ncbi:hypothetical protein [Streptomyces sp. NPDC058613]|uniref:hypothetical protein n=1 Tax=Streptomyces sp. NPDC058613 TaxID=3346556 RepID=UPI00365DBA27
MFTPGYGRESARRGSPGAADVWRTPGGRIPLLREVTPGRAGVHPAEGPGGPPAYVPRDAEALLHAALAAPGPRFVLVVGEARAGATRLAYEVVRAVHPRYAFVRPLSRAALPEAVRVAARRRRAVLWLDGLDDHLGAGGLTAAHLDGLRGAVVVATMRAAEYRRHQAREASRLTGCDRGAWRTEAELLGRAAVVPVARSWSPRERRRAAARRDDPRIGAALEAGEGRGPAEVLAGGERSVARWTGGWTPGAQPAGAAVVAAAVDCRRAGLRRPVARAWLRALYPAYLAGRDGGARGAGRGAEPGSATGSGPGAGEGFGRGSGGATGQGFGDAFGEAFGPALVWACAAVHRAGAGGLLAGSDVLGYTADGCLLDAPGLGPVPEHLWRGLLARAGPGDAYDLGLVARQEGRPARAVRALTAARRGGVAEAELPLALAVGDAGRPRRAAADLAALTRRRELRLGPRHPDTLAARHQLAFFTGEAGHAGAAAARFGLLAADAGAVLGPGHPDTLAARHQLAFFTGEAGDPRAAARQLACLLADALPVLGADHPRVLAVRRGLIWYRPAEPAGAGREWAALLADTEGHLGPDDPHTLAVRAGQAALAARTGRTAEAVRAWAALTADRARVLGSDHPHVVHSRLEWARALIADGRQREASELLLRVVGEAGRFLEPGHRHLRLARELRAGLTAAAPEPP